MSTINHKVQFLNKSGTGYDTYHAETNVSQVYDFAKAKWLNEIIEDLERKLANATGGIDVTELSDNLALTMEDLNSVESLVEAIQVELAKKYVKPETGITLEDLSESIKSSLAKADRLPAIEQEIERVRVDIQEYIDQEIRNIHLSMRVINEKFIATEGQRVFTLENEYNLNTNTLKLEVGGVEQYAPENFTKNTDSNGVTTITFVDALPQGLEVIVSYFGGVEAINTVLEMHSEDISHLSGRMRTLETQVDEGGYTHPDTHPASMIIEDASRRFVTDAEKTSWNNKASIKLASTSENGLMSKEDKAKINSVEVEANKYVHPLTHPASMIIEDASRRFVTDAEKEKIRSIEEGATSYTHPDTHPASMIVQDSNNRFVTDVEKAKLSGIEAGANKYIHPTSHPASMITEDANRRFTTDVEKNGWNKAKTDVANVQTNVSNIQNGIYNIENRLTTLEQSSGSGGSPSDFQGLTKEVAYLKLKQEASERIEGGVTFADDMDGNSFGMNFDEGSSSNILMKKGKMLLSSGGGATTNNNNINISGVTPYLKDVKSARKMAILDNGVIYIALYVTSSKYAIYYSDNVGTTWNFATDITVPSKSISNIAICTDGIDVHIAYTNTETSGASVFYKRLITDSNTLSAEVRTSFYGSSLTENLSITVDRVTKNVHIFVTSRGSTLIESQYCRGVADEYGNISTLTASFIASGNFNSYWMLGGVILLNESSNPIVIYGERYSSRYTLKTFAYNGSKMIQGTSIASSLTMQTASAVDAIFVPKSVNNLEKGRIWVTYAYKASDSNYDSIYVSYSDDGGTTWSAEKKILDGGLYASNQASPMITANKKNEISVIYALSTSSTNHHLAIIKTIDNGETWTSDILTDKSIVYRSVNIGDTLTCDVLEQPLLYQSSDGIYFKGGLSAGAGQPETNSVAVYNLPSTSFVGMYVKKIGDVNITAYINGNQMDSELIDDEYQFSGTLATEQPVTIRLNLSRASITGRDNDAVVRIIGGRA